MFTFKPQLFQIFIFVLFFTSISCSQGIDTNKNSISIPKQTNDGLSVGSLSVAEIDSTKLLKLLGKINSGEYKEIHSVLIIKDNKLVFEEYFPGYDFEYSAAEHKGKLIDHDLNTIHNLASVTKSVTSLLFGIAVDKGFIKDEHEKLYKFFSQDSVLFEGSKKNITLQNLLTMSSGLKWNENDMPYSNTANDIVQLFIVSDPVKYILSKPLANEPGTNFYYNGGGTNLIGKIIQERSKLRLNDFTQKYLFDPLGIKQNKWVYINPGFVYASGDLRLRPRDMAKLGLLALNKGVWNGSQIISSEWIDKIKTKHVWMNDTDGYGYQWWLKKYKFGSTEINTYFASGWGGQMIIVAPKINSVIVLTAGNYIEKSPHNEILNRYIFPSIIKDFTYDFGAIENATPLPDSLKIINPNSGVKNDIAVMSGCWYGSWGYYLPSRLIVEKINDTKAEVIYSWADIPGQLKKGWIRKAAAVDPNGNITFTNGDVSWKYYYDKEDNALIGFYDTSSIHEKIIMKRRE